MSLTVETGQMEPGANSCATVADVDEWQSARNSETWPPAPESPDPDNPEPNPNMAAKDAAILKATDFLNGLNWIGRRAAPGRLMAWPRAEVIDQDGYRIASNIVHEQLKAACCYLAGLTFDGTDLQPVLERGDRIQSQTISRLSKHFSRTLQTGTNSALCLTSWPALSTPKGPPIPSRLSVADPTFSKKIGAK